MTEDTEPQSGSALALRQGMAEAVERLHELWSASLEDAARRIIDAGHDPATCERTQYREPGMTGGIVEEVRINGKPAYRQRSEYDLDEHRIRVVREWLMEIDDE